MAVIGFAAFSPSANTEPDDTETIDVADSTDPQASARVASAVLALRMSDAESRTATTQATAELESLSAESDNSTTTSTDTSTSTEPSTTEATTSTGAPSTTSAPATTEPRDTTPPSLRITSPDDGATVTDRIITFSGTTEPGAEVAAGPYDADVSDDGHWSIQLVLAPGDNGALFTAKDAAGNTESARIVVTYDAPTTTTKAPTVTTTTSGGSTPTTTSAAPKWSPNWPADAGGQRSVESWRATVSQYWSAERVDCVLGIIHRESKGNARAYNSSSSAEGLMQHLSKYWHSRAAGAGFIDGNGLVATPYNGAANIAAGAYLANWAETYQPAWWWPWKSSGGTFTATYGSCTGSNPP